MSERARQINQSGDDEKFLRTLTHSFMTIFNPVAKLLYAIQETKLEIGMDAVDD